MIKKLGRDFFTRDVLIVAPELVGKLLCVKTESGEIIKQRITQTEAYKGTEDKGCHASKGKTDRTKVMFELGGRIYVYLVYGMHWLFNIVTGKEDEPEAVLIRETVEYGGPAKLTKALKIGKTFYGEDITESERIWVEDDGYKPEIKTLPRVGIDYAGEYWANIEWRFADSKYLKQN